MSLLGIFSDCRDFFWKTGKAAFCEEMPVLAGFVDASGRSLPEPSFFRKARHLHTHVLTFQEFLTKKTTTLITPHLPGLAPIKPFSGLLDLKPFTVKPTQRSKSQFSHMPLPKLRTP